MEMGEKVEGGKGWSVRLEQYILDSGRSGEVGFLREFCSSTARRFQHLTTESRLPTLNGARSEGDQAGVGEEQRRARRRRCPGKIRRKCSGYAVANSKELRRKPAAFLQRLAVPPHRAHLALVAV